MRYYVCSDVHGFYTELRQALKKAGFDGDTEPHKLLIVGDLCDRGSEAKGLQEFILRQMEQEQLIFVRGNHEDLFEELVTVDRGYPFEHHIFNGTYDTALQLTGFSLLEADTDPAAFTAAAKATPFYRSILPAAIDWYETEHYIFTHGWLPCHRKFDGTPLYNPSWRNADAEEWREAR